MEKISYETDTLLREYILLTPDEEHYGGNPLTHVDFLSHNRLDKAPVLAIELDGTSFHQEGSGQAQRDAKKNRIFQKCGMPLLRIRTDASWEDDVICEALRKCV